MPLPSTGFYPISNKDLVSFTFDDPNFDQEKPIYIDPEDPSINLNYNQLKSLVRKLVAGLHAAGLQKGDTVCVHSFNSIYYAAILLAVIGAGGLVVGTNPGYTKAELSHGVRVAQIKFVLAEPDIYENMLQALRDNNIDVGRRLFLLDTRSDQKVPQGMRSWNELLRHGEKDWFRFNSEPESTNTTALLYYTSGTTGLPKCAEVTHRNLVAQHQLWNEANPRSYRHDAVLSMPFFHAGINPTVLVSVIKEGRNAYVMRRFELEPYLRYTCKYKCTVVTLVPPMVNAIVMSGLADPKSPNYKPECSLRSVRHGTAGAAPLSADLQKRFSTLLGPGASYTQVWGMSETCCVGTMIPLDQTKDSWGSVGRPLKNLTVKLCDEDGNDTTKSGKGELCIKGPTIVKGYYHNEKATRDSWDNEGFFKTGDVVEADPKTELLYVVERLKELIKVRGFQVAPAELEGTLTEHPDIIDAAVIGIKQAGGQVKSEDDNELPRAYLVKRQGSRVTEADVRRHMEDKLSRYKQLTGGIVFVDTIPKLPSGKILKRVLREEYKKEVGSNGSSKL